ncbi:MAG: hypothetical protein [Bacteriophage sp.]|nr:MAG: hypothetical protein [Bacteriophage sp.]
MATLYELTGKYQQLLQIADDVDPRVFKDTLDSIKDSIDVKAINYAKVDRQLGADITEFKNEINRMTQRLNSMINNRKRLRENLLYNMQSVGKTKIKDRLFTINVQKNRQLLDYDTNRIPKELLIKKETYTPDKDKIQQMLDEGQDVDGVSYKPEKYHLTIR